MEEKALANEKVCIVIPCRNSGRYLPMTIESIFKTFSFPFKIIIVESESSDGTAEYCDKVAAANPERIEIHHIPKQGTTKAYNYGIQKAGDCDVLLTQDDVIFHPYLERDMLFEFHSYCKNNPTCGICTVCNGGGISGPLYLSGFKWTGTWCMYIPRRTINKLKFYEEI